MQQDGAIDPENHVLPIRGKAVARLLRTLVIDCVSPDRLLAEYDVQRKAVRVFGDKETGVAEMTGNGHFRISWFDHGSALVHVVTAALPDGKVQSSRHAFVDDHRPSGAPLSMIMFNDRQASELIRDAVEECFDIAAGHMARRVALRLAPVSG